MREIMQELSAAIHAGDLDKAKEVLDVVARDWPQQRDAIARGKVLGERELARRLPLFHGTHRRAAA